MQVQDACSSFESRLAGTWAARRDQWGMKNTDVSASSLVNGGAGGDAISMESAFETCSS